MEKHIKSPLLQRERTVSPLAYRIKEAAAALGVGRTTIYRLIQNGQLNVVRVGNRSLIPVEALEAFLARGGEQC